MKMFYSKSRSGIVFMVVLAMLLQIIIPATEFVYAEENDSILIDKDFSIELGEDEEGKVTVKWEYVYRPDGKRKFNLKLGSIFEQYKEETENLMSGEIKIGEYTVSRNGEITINIDEDIDTIVEGLQEKTEVEQPGTPVVPAPVHPEDTTITDGNKGDDTGVIEDEDTDGSGVIDGTKEDDEVEGTVDDSTDKTEEPTPEVTGRIGKPLVSLAYTGDMEGLELGDGNDESYTFSGSFVVEEERPSTFRINDSSEEIPKNEITMNFLGLEVTDNGTTVTIKNNDDAKDIELKEGQKAKIYYEFELDLSKPYAEGSSFTFQLPQSIMVFDASSLSGEIEIADEPPFKFETDKNGLVTVTFLEDVDPGEYNIKLDFSAEFGNFKDEDDLDQEIEIPIAGKKSITIDLTFLPSTSEEKMIKKGTPKNENGIRTIDWEVWVNRAGEYLKNAKFEDSLGEGHSLVSNSIKVEKYPVGLKGVSSTEELNEIVTTGGFPLTLENGKYAYKITYTTEITRVPENESEIFTNKAILKDSSDGELDSKSATVDITYGTPLSKKLLPGSDKYEAYWEIEYNYLGAAINSNEAKITDILTGAHKIDGTSIEVYEVEINSEGKGGAEKKLTKDSDYEIDLSDLDKKLVIDFSKSAENEKVTKAFKVKYKTVSTDEFITEDGVVRNTVTSTNQNSDEEKYEAHGELWLGEGIFDKSIHSIDYSKKEITWNLSIYAEKDLKNFKIVDQFTKDIEGKTRQELVVLDDQKTGVDKYFNIDSNGYSKNNITLEEASENEGYTLKFTQTINKGTRINISYKTKFEIDEDGTVYKYGNIATSTWKGTNDEENTIEKEDEYNPGDSNTAKNGYKNGKFDYEKQEFTWNIAVNINKKNINSATLTDKLGPGHHIPVEDGEDLKDKIRIQRLELGINDETGKPKEELPQEKWSIVSIEEDGKVKGFTITFKELDSNQNNQAYYISYTSVDSDNIHGRLDDDGKRTGEYSNNAVFKTSDSKKYELSANVIVKEHNELINKGAKQNPNEETITWTIDINKSHSNLGQIVLTDKLSTNQMLLKDTIKVRETSFNANGTINYGDWKDIKEGTGTLTVKIIEDGFELDLGKLDRKGYQVEYKTFFTGGDNERFTNTATINYEGANIEEDGDKGEGGGNYQFNSSSGNISSSRGTIKLHKVGYNPATEEISNLEGVTFALYNITGEYKLYEAESDENGLVTFENIRYGKYVIKEESGTPQEYIKADNITFEMKEDTDYNINPNEDKMQKVVNTRLNQGVKLKKVDAQGDNLEGVVFELYGSDGNLVKKDKYENALPESYRTDENGEILIDDLDEGKYYFMETETLDGYWLDKSLKIEFEVKNGEITNLEPIKNYRQGNLTIKKVDEKTGKLLEGAEFTLYDTSNNKIATATTDKDGIATFTNIKYGSYILNETDAPVGYLGNSEDINITIDSSKLEKTIENQKIHQAVELTKVDEDTKTPLSGAVFELYKKGDSSDELVTEDESGDSILEKLTTNNEGKIAINNLPPGDYYFKEVKAPKYYLLPDDYKVEFSIEPNQTTITTPAPAENSRGKGKIELTKIGKIEGNEDTKIPLEGVEFALYDADKNKVGTALLTGEDGKVVFTNLPYGKYFIKETKALDEYVPNEELIEVDLDGDGEPGKTLELPHIINIKKDHSVRLIKYNANKSRSLKGANFELRKEIAGKYEVVEKYKSLITDNNGEIYLEDLPAGKYQLIETKAPSGYVLDKNPVDFEIDENQTNTLELEKTNRRQSDPDPGPSPDPGPGPDRPTRPTDPKKPTTPVDPTKPTEPVEPVDPTDPVEITEVPEPDEPEIPIVITPPKGGTVEFDEDGNWKYTPNPGFTGKDSFILKHPDGTEELIEIDVEAPRSGLDEDGTAPKLPKTGEINSVLISLAGLFFILVGIILRRRTA